MLLEVFFVFSDFQIQTISARLEQSLPPSQCPDVWLASHITILAKYVNRQETYRKVT